MSWFTENKFVAVFGGFMLVGAGALGYLTMGASDEYAKAKSNYDDKAGELRGLYDAKPSLAAENLEAFQARQKSLKAEIEKFQKELAAIEIKPEQVTAIAFQDKLKEAVARVVAKAGEMGMELPKEKLFYLGFEEYQNTPPKEAAATALLRQLRGIEIMVNLLLQSKNVELKRISRVELPEEKKQPEAPKPGSKGKPEEEKKLVQRSSFLIEFVAPQTTFQKTLNGLAGNNQQFFVVRNVSVTNEKKDPPVKEDKTPPAQVVDPNNPQPVAPVKEKEGVEKIFGNERVNVVLDIDMLDFAEPEVPSDKPGANKQPK
jgi:hypothetical protein